MKTSKALLNGIIPEVNRTTFKTSMTSSRLKSSSFFALDSCFKKEELLEKPIKIVCTFEAEEDLAAFKAHCRKLPLFKNTYIANSWNTGLEFNSLDGTKGSAIKFIKDFLPHIHTCVAIGDYENDIPMLKAADIAVCVGDGSKEVKEKADLIVANAKEGAVADLIRILEEKIKKKENIAY